MKTGKLFVNLVNLMATLRSKNGCPWDKKQTHKSLKPYLIEETCEVLDSIDKKSPGKLKDELGDLMYQILFHSQIAKEKNRFTINDVLDNAYKKLRHRHPHVFGDIKIRGAENVVEHWHKFKLKEARKKSKNFSLVSNIPMILPALQKAGKVQHKAAIAGFDWRHSNEILEKIDEELREVKYAIKQKKPSKITEEIGDLLFAIASLARYLGIEPENALHQTIRKFIIRFQKLEKYLAKKGKNIEECTLEEMEKAWNLCKS